MSTGKTASNARVSVVVIALNEGSHLASTVRSLDETLPADADILVVDDGSEDGSADFLEGSEGRIRLIRSKGLGVARARNWGARQTTGDVIIWADAHIETPPNWTAPLIEALNGPRVAAVAPAIYDSNDTTRSRGYGLYFSAANLRAGWLPRKGDEPYAVPILPGCTLAMRREIFEQTGGCDDGLLSRGGVDNEFGVRFNLQGWELHVVPTVAVSHFFRKVSPYTVKWDTYLHNYIRLALLHFSEPRRKQVLEALSVHEGFDNALAFSESRIGSRRDDLARTRVYDDDWFFERFQMQW